ncbi:hypothetical protein ACEWY4_009758 [Coilia grayii]|uniref:Active breakpoint cluster region-related protein n=1 Tax=Coilia grayii TaxID=363190 RepID=A0ABD1K7B6_9TELE
MEEDEEEVLGMLDKVLEDEEEQLDSEMDLDSPLCSGEIGPHLLRPFQGDIEKGLEMKKLVLSGFLASEEIYINQLEALLLPMRPLKAAATTSKPVLSVEQIETIFYKIQDIHEIHKEFYDALLPHIQQWDDKVTVGHLFKKLASQLGIYKAFVDNYKVAVETAEKCAQANSQFQKISENLKVKGPKESKDHTSTVTMEALLYKPIDRVTRSTLVLHDLLKHTPKDHPDFPLLQDALRISQNFLSSINEEIDPRRTAVTTPKGEARQLVKDGFLVEVSEGSRKLRHIFLFTDLLLCAKMKKTAVGKHQQYECKWYIPLADLALQTLDDSADSTPHVQTLTEHELDEMKNKICGFKSEIQKEKVKGQSRVVDRLRKKMNEQESCLLLHSPTIPFRIHNKNGKSYLFLLSSDYERSEWRESIEKLQKKDLQACVLSTVELQVLTGFCFKLRTVHNIPLTSHKDDEESPGLYGFLHVIVHSATGFKESANLYCTLEVDSFGYFVGKAKTRVFRDTTEPHWNEEFEIELEGSQCLRILCYEKCYDKTKLNKDDNEIVDKIVGKGQVQDEEQKQEPASGTCISLPVLPTPDQLIAKRTIRPSEQRPFFSEAASQPLGPSAPQLQACTGEMALNVRHGASAIWFGVVDTSHRHIQFDVSSRLATALSLAVAIGSVNRTSCLQGQACKARKSAKVFYHIVSGHICAGIVHVGRFGSVSHPGNGAATGATFGRRGRWIPGMVRSCRSDIQKPGIPPPP